MATARDETSLRVMRMARTRAKARHASIIPRRAGLEGGVEQGQDLEPLGVVPDDVDQADEGPPLDVPGVVDDADGQAVEAALEPVARAQGQSRKAAVLFDPDHAAGQEGSRQILPAHADPADENAPDFRGPDSQTADPQADDLLAGSGSKAADGDAPEFFARANAQAPDEDPLDVLAGADPESADGQPDQILTRACPQAAEADAGQVFPATDAQASHVKARHG